MSRKKNAHRILAVVFWILIWQILAVVIHNDILLVDPITACKHLLFSTTELAFWTTVGMSFLRITAGFILGLIVAICLAGLSYRFSFVETLFHPLIAFLKAIPMVSFVVLLLIWWGADNLSVIISFFVVLPNLYVSILSGLKNTSKSLLEMARVFRMPLWNRFFYVYRPALRSFLYSGLTISLGMCWKSGVAAEVIGTPAFSIGEKLYLSKVHLDTAGIFSWTIVILILSKVFERLWFLLMDCFFKWEPACFMTKAREPIVENGLECKHVDLSYGDKIVLEDFNASYDRERIYYLTWPSGAGKTTLIRLLCGLEKPNKGSIVRRGLVSCQFQEDRLCEDYSAVRNVEMILGNREKSVNSLLKLLAREDIDKPVKQLSGGMKRRVSLVRAVEADSDYLFLDEPYTGMDLETREAAKKYIQDNKRDRILIIAAHFN